MFPQFIHTPYTTDSVDMEPRHSIAVEHSQCSDLGYTIFSQSEESAAVLVLTHDNREISHLMNEEDNQEITRSWEILNKEPNYKTLAQDIICDFFDFTYWPLQFTIKYNESNQSGNRTIDDLYKFTIALVKPSNYYFQQNLCFQRNSTAILFTSTFPSVPVFLVSLSQKTHRSDVIATSS